MAYKVIMSTEAAKGFRKLDSGIQKRIAALRAKIVNLGWCFGLAAVLATLPDVIFAIAELVK